MTHLNLSDFMKIDEKISVSGMRAALDKSNLDLVQSAYFEAFLEDKRLMPTLTPEAELFKRTEALKNAFDALQMAVTMHYMAQQLADGSIQNKFEVLEKKRRVSLKKRPRSDE